MRILITSAASDASRLLVDGLGGTHEVVATDLPEVAEPVGAVACALEADDATRDLVSGVKALVHVARLSAASADAFEQADNAFVDFHSRCTYNLLSAASAAGVGHAIYLSSLSLYATCDTSWNVTEKWAPRPTTDIDTLRHAIGEFTCREFARERRVRVTCLRIGTLGDEPVPDQLKNADLVTAVGKALDHPPAEWAVYHVQSDVPERRFDTSKAAEVGYLEGGRP